jgi:hypothetical protein
MLEANAFLPHQVRRMAGALVEVGRGKLGVEAYVGLLEGAPGSAGPAAPPHGLYLERVEYAEDPFRLGRPPSQDAFLGQLRELAPVPGVFVMGGVAEDALLHQRVTRVRSDIDLLVEASSWRVLQARLREAGFAPFERKVLGPAGEALAYASITNGIEVEVWLAERAADGQGFAIVLPGHGGAAGGGFFGLRLPPDTFQSPKSHLSKTPVQTVSPLALSLFLAASARTRGDAQRRAADEDVRQRLIRALLLGAGPAELEPDITPIVDPARRLDSTRRL